jgi:hypothetical protein
MWIVHGKYIDFVVPVMNTPNSRYKNIHEKTIAESLAGMWHQELAC